MKIVLTLPPQDPEYLERRGGIGLLTHLRGAPARVRYRGLAIDSAFDRFVAAERDRVPESAVGGLGLIALQRALLAAEDLGGVLHAFDGPDPWARLRSTKVSDITSVFERVLDDGEAALETIFRLATDDEIAAEGLTEEQFALLRHLRGLVAQRWLARLRRAAELWTGSPIAKATMHGFPIVAGAEVLGPPPAGVLARALAQAPQGRFAAALISSSRRRQHVETSVVPVPLDRVSIERICREGRAAAELYGELCAMHATSAELGMRAFVPWWILEELSGEQRSGLEGIAAARGRNP